MGNELRAEADELKALLRAAKKGGLPPDQADYICSVIQQLSEELEADLYDALTDA